MKRVVVIVLSFMAMLGVTACSASKPKAKVTAESAVTALQEKIPDITNITVYDEKTDPNENLGRPGQYIGKADFFDARMENKEDNAGTIEVFTSKSDCKGRYDYLCKLSDPGLGALGVNQYIYKYDFAVFRVSYDLTPSQAEEYKQAMDEIIEEVSKQYKR